MAALNAARAATREARRRIRRGPRVEAVAGGFDGNVHLLAGRTARRGR